MLFKAIFQGDGLCCRGFYMRDAALRSKRNEPSRMESKATSGTGSTVHLWWCLHPTNKTAELHSQSGVQSAMKLMVQVGHKGNEGKSATLTQTGRVWSVTQRARWLLTLLWEAYFGVWKVCHRCAEVLLSCWQMFTWRNSKTPKIAIILVNRK